ncbi:MAG: VWA domain-containing protein, partial [Acidobacteriota bacterium]
DLPVSVGIVLDTSGSMRGSLAQAKGAVRAFFDACNPEDEAFLYTVSTRPMTNSTFTSDFYTLLSHTLFFGANGSTALVDTIFAALRQSRAARNPGKALLVISDGMDNHSRYSKSELMAAAEEADLQIYSISVFDPPPNRKPIGLTEERDGISFLQELTRRTGGFQIVARNEEDIQRGAAAIGRAIRNQYVIGYIPKETRSDGVWHSIKVKLNVPNAVVYARSGFFAR